jgi:hypothetical protein
MKTAYSVTLAAAVALLGASHASACTPTGFYRDNINMTAAIIAVGDVKNQTVNATGCNVGIFYGPGTNGTVDSSSVSGANYFGILVVGNLVDSGGNETSPGATSVDVTNSVVNDIGENPFNGTQHGVAIYYRACATDSSATGTISGNAISAYQKGGITVNCPGAAVSVNGNTVVGNGPVNYIAQNGIQIGFGASGHVMRNTVTGNSYTGMNNASSAGILVFGGCGGELTTGVQIVANIVGDATPADGNDIGVALANYDPTCVTAPSAATNNKVINNVLTDDETTNVSGNGYPSGYPAGISDSGVNDKLINNDISGQGYATYPCPSTTATEHCAIDTDPSSAAKVHANSLNP